MSLWHQLHLFKTQMFNTDGFPCSFTNAGCPPLLHNGVSEPHYNRFWRQIMRHSEQFHSTTPAHLLFHGTFTDCSLSVSGVSATAVSNAAPRASLHRSLFGQDVSKHWTLHGLLCQECPFRISVGISACCLVVSLPAVAWYCTALPSRFPDRSFHQSSSVITTLWHKATHAKVATVRRDFRIGKEICHRRFTQQTGTASDRRSGLLPSPGA